MWIERDSESGADMIGVDLEKARPKLNPFIRKQILLFVLYCLIAFGLAVCSVAGFVTGDARMLLIALVGGLALLPHLRKSLRELEDHRF